MYLKELYNLTDQEVLGSLEFDLRWQYAFDINVFEAHICIRSGIEATSSEANRLTGLKRSWTRGKIVSPCQAFSKPWP
jgi:hypothetical protein